MKVKWLGHSCFLLTANNGTRVLTDPFDASVGYAVPEVEADIVSTSHAHFDHSYVQAVKGEFFHVSGIGCFSHKGIEIIGVGAFHDSENGAQRGKNTIYKFVVDGIHICHCGDLGHILSSQQVKEIGHVDILLIPVGGFYTIGPEQAAEVIGKLSPAVVIPMHFKTAVIEFPIKGVEAFLQEMGGGQRTGKQEVEFNEEYIRTMPGVIVLEYAPKA
jgi:L-ascorbate metabolism protein UlaG (beta-lactamase superfamily)